MQNKSTVVSGTKLAECRYRLCIATEETAMTVAEAWYLAGVILVFLLLLALIGWGMLQTNGLQRPPIGYE